ncbi:urea carboxylase-associated family protein [Actinophytocola gossypii]|uniref:Urea carboxylase-associated family protein n=1 Tax=Actinophytocola gossypii TaxID=2812003 RepID=A0ABT2J2Y1_9PSEU|nr:urea carboxylase-associated family protein [Actinophytocola gossypii]MCT2582201.1 urea carboxylase-associated family protein [Actinophytocola gossypii]
MQLTLRNRVVVPAREGRRIDLRTGEHLRVVTEEGGQVGDLFACTGTPAEWLSAAHTRVHHSRLFPEIGQPFVTTRRRPILTLVEDTSPGRHDMLLPACDPVRYAALGVTGWHASCAENLRTALGLDLDVVPQPVNLFMDIPVTPAGELRWNSSPAGPGAAVTVRAESDCVVVVSACPQDLSGINAGTPKPLVLERLVSWT